MPLGLTSSFCYGSGAWLMFRLLVLVPRLLATFLPLLSSSHELLRIINMMSDLRSFTLSGALFSPFALVGSSRAKINVFFLKTRFQNSDRPGEIPSESIRLLCGCLPSRALLLAVPGGEHDHGRSHVGLRACNQATTGKLN